MSPTGGASVTHRAALGWVGEPVGDPKGIRVGWVAGIVVDRETGALVWVLLESPSFGLRAAPVGDVHGGNDERLSLAVTVSVVESGPPVPRNGAFTGKLEQELVRVYRLPLPRGAGRAWERRRTTGLLGVTPDDVLTWKPGPPGKDSGPSMRPARTSADTGAARDEDTVGARSRRGRSASVVRQALGRLKEEAAAAVAAPPPRNDGTAGAEMPSLRRLPSTASTDFAAANAYGNGGESAGAASSPAAPAAGQTSPPVGAVDLGPPPDPTPVLRPSAQAPRPVRELADLLQAVDEIEAAAASITSVGVLLASSDTRLWHPLVRELGHQPRLRVRGCLGDGTEVLAVVEADAVDVVLLDLERLDGLDAVAVVKALRAAGHVDVPVLLLTRVEGAFGEIAPGVEVASVADPAAVAGHALALFDGRR